MLDIRIAYDTGRWSNVIQQNFYVHKIISAATSIISKAEYFVDNDPGFGLATPITISTPGKNISLTFEINPGILSQGFHMLVIRTCDDAGHWSMSTQQIFYVFSAEPSGEPYITGLEFYIDNDPGFGKGKHIPVATPDRTVSVDFTADLDGVGDGDHVLYVRAVDEDGRWSHNSATAFSVLVTGIGNMVVTSWMKVYPNPNEGHFMIEFGDLPEGSIKLTIKDLNGRTVFTKEYSGDRIPLDLDLAGGIYMITIETGKKIFNQRIVIDR